jgi:hypothetical protein
MESAYGLDADMRYYLYPQRQPGIRLYRDSEWNAHERTGIDTRAVASGIT